jgi:hypothetical protein
MKSIIIFTFLLISTSLSANDAHIVRFMDAQTTMLQAQIDQLKSAIALTQTGISKTEQYEKIGKPSFAATDNALRQAGFSVKSYYRFKERYQQPISDWLSQHAAKASEIEQLQRTRDNLSQTLEGAN